MKKQMDIYYKLIYSHHPEHGKEMSLMESVCLPALIVTLKSLVYNFIFNLLEGEISLVSDVIIIRYLNIVETSPVLSYIGTIDICRFMG